MTTSGHGLYFDVWNGYSIETPIHFGGTDYEINSAAQLAWLAEHVDETPGKTYTLTENINLAGNEWKPIGVNSDRFRGNFNGGGYIIKGLRLPNAQLSGLFGFIQGVSSTTPSEITDLKIELLDCSYTGSVMFAVGGLVGSAENVIISKISVSGGKLNLSGSYQNRVGGIAGVLDNYSKIEDCISTINITVRSTSYLAYAGGIVGFIQNSSTISVISCYTEGNIVSISTIDVACSGGVVGFFNGVGSASCVRCFAMNGSITATGNSSSQVGRIGGSTVGTYTNNVANINMALIGNSTPLTHLRHGIVVNLTSMRASVYTNTGAITANSSGNITSGGLDWNPTIWDFSGIRPKLR